MSAAAGSSGPPPPGGNGPGRNSKDSTPRKSGGSAQSTPKKGGTTSKQPSTPGSESKSPAIPSRTSTPGSRSVARGSSTSTPSKKWGDGKSKETAQWSETLRNDSSQQPQFVLDRKVTSPRWIRESLANAREAIGIGYDFYHGVTLQRIEESSIPGGPGAGGSTNPTTPFYSQQQNTLHAERDLEQHGIYVGQDEDVIGEDEDDADEDSDDDDEN